MRTFSIQALGCKVNQYEAEQIATFLRSRGMVQAPDRAAADLRVVHTCSVTVQAASKSRQTVRRATRLPVLSDACSSPEARATDATPTRTVVTGCWATSSPADAKNIPGVDAVITNHEDLGGRLSQLLDDWRADPSPTAGVAPRFNDLRAGGRSLPLLDGHQTAHQRAFLKIQDGCDAFCTYCIIPQLRPAVWSKPVDQCVEEAQRLVDCGHVELVLTGIFLGAYGHETAIRKRQDRGCAVANLIDALCTRVRGLKRLRLSSLEPGDMSDELIDVLRSHEQIVPHFHLPLQSGSDAVLRKMNRQYRRDDYLRMLDRVRAAFDRPAITTDIIVGFPGETDEEFQRTLDIVDRARFIHTHAFHFSPRPGTAAARWTGDFVRGPVVNRRVERLNELARRHSVEFRAQFVGQAVQVLVERIEHPTRRHGRCERYFDVEFESPAARAGDAVVVRIDQVNGEQTRASLERE